MDITLFVKEMSRIFEDFSKGFALDPLSKRTDAAFEPKVNVSESEREIVVSAELPGMDDKDIDVSLSKNELTIQGEKKEEKKSYSRMESSYGPFKRTILLPCKVEDDKVEAHFKNGVLTITLPKAPEAIKEAKKINIKSG